MNLGKLFAEAKDHLEFVLVVILIVAVILVVAALAEKWLFKGKEHKAFKTRNIAVIGMLSAIATILMLFEIPLPFAPSFYELDFSELPILIGSFALGPVAGVAIELCKILLKLVIKGTTTAFVGDFANFVVGCSFVLPATFWYHFHKSKHSAIIGLVLGTLSMAILGSAFNAVYLLPKFSQLFGLPLDTIIAMGTAVRGGVHNVSTFVMLCVAPLNVVKGAMVSVLTMLLYKRVARPLFGIHA